MITNIPDEFIELKGRIIDTLSQRVDVEDAEPGFTREDIDRCDAILMRYLAEVFEPGVQDDEAQIMAAVEAVVVALNTLNDDCDQSLIDTDEREPLCELIIHAAGDAGLVSDVYDITEEWRDW